MSTAIAPNLDWNERILLAKTTPTDDVSLRVLKGATRNKLPMTTKLNPEMLAPTHARL